MREITIYNDIHLCGPHPMQVNWEYGQNHYYLGDNVDLSHCLKKDIMKALVTLTFMNNLFPGRFVRGNHELNAIDQPDKLVVGNTLLTHGDYIFWTKKYAEKYRQRPHGTTWFKKWFSLSGLDFMRHILPEARLHRRTLRKLAFMARANKCTMIVVGHRHPKNIIRYEYKGIRILVLPPGKNKIEIDG